MKTLKLLLTAILLMIAYAANAQTIQLYKDGVVVKEYSAAEVDSVVYKPAAAQPRYYYYAGWDCPTSVEGDEETSLVNLINKTYPRSKSDNTQNKAGGEIVGDLTTFKYEYYSPNNLYNSASLTNYFVAVPNGLSIYDSLGGDLLGSAFDETPVKVFDNHKVYKSTDTSRNINAIEIRK